MVEEVLPAANPDSVTTNTSRSVPINNVTTISTSQATRVGPSNVINYQDVIDRVVFFGDWYSVISQVFA